MLGRYIEVDPIGLNGGINLYVYVRNKPLRYIDINGKKYESIPRIIGFARHLFHIVEPINTFVKNLYGELSAVDDEYIGSDRERLDLYKMIDKLEEDIAEDKKRLDKLIDDLNQRKQRERCGN